MFGMQLANREVGSQIPISIPTAVALESMIDRPNEWAPELWINLRTLFRNLVSSVESDVKNNLKVPDVLAVLKTELEMIPGIVTDISKGKTKVQYYCCNYNDLTLILPYAIMRPMRTPLQEKMLKLETETMKTLLKEYKNSILEFKTKLDGKSAEALMISHHAVDLLSANTFRKLRLLESHTGTIKKPSEWNTKLTNGKELSNIPFNKFSLQVFGDNNTVLSQMDRKTREVVLEVAAKGRWTNVTTMDKIKFDIGNMRDHFSKTILLKYCRS